MPAVANRHADEEEEEDDKEDEEEEEEVVASALISFPASCRGLPNSCLREQNE